MGTEQQYFRSEKKGAPTDIRHTSRSVVHSVFFINSIKISRSLLFVCIHQTLHSFIYVLTGFLVSLLNGIFSHLYSCVCACVIFVPVISAFFAFLSVVRSALAYTHMHVLYTYTIYTEKICWFCM